MHGMIEKRGRKGAVAKPVRAQQSRAAARKPSVRSAPVAEADAPLTLKITPRLNRALTKVATRTGKPKHYHVRRALERYLEDTWDYLEAEASYKATRRTYSWEEVKKRLGMEG
jgi:predicted DNA-binding protein